MSEFITTAEAARRLGVTRRHVRWLIEHRHLDAERLGRDFLVRKDSLARARHRPGPGRPKKAS